MRKSQTKSNEYAGKCYIYLFAFMNQAFSSLSILTNILRSLNKTHFSLPGLKEQIPNLSYLDNRRKVSASHAKFQEARGAEETWRSCQYPF